MKKNVFNEICIGAISILNLFIVIVATESNVKRLSLIIAIICVIYYLSNFNILKFDRWLIWH